MTTLKKIAAVAGVSDQTVSRILNKGAGLHRSATCERVLDAATRLGYRANAGARALRTGRHEAIGLLLSEHRHRAAMSRAALWAIEQELLTHNSLLAIGILPDKPLADGHVLPRILSHWSVDGLIVSYASAMPPEVEVLIRRHRIPAVWINAKREADCVYPDDFGAAHTATQRLLALGHRRISYLFLAGDREHHSTADRLAGYAAAMQAAGLRPAPAEAVGSLHAPATFAFTTECLKRRPRPTAFVTYGPREATILLFAASQLGLQVPRDLSIIAIHDEPLTDSGVQTTTMCLPAETMGREAVRLIERRIGAASATMPPVVLPFDYFEGATTASPRTHK